VNVINGRVGCDYRGRRAVAGAHFGWPNEVAGSIRRFAMTCMDIATNGLVVRSGGRSGYAGRQRPLVVILEGILSAGLLAFALGVFAVVVVEIVVGAL
jgi:hypothetical protein